MLCTVTSTLVPPSTEITRRTITFPVSSPIWSPSMTLSPSVLGPISRVRDPDQVAPSAMSAVALSTRSPFWKMFSVAVVPNAGVIWSGQLADADHRRRRS